MKIWKKNLVVTAVLLTVCGGIYVNWMYGQDQTVADLTDTLDENKILSADKLVMADETATVYEVDTDGEYLIDAMNDAEGLSFQGEEGIYGLSVSTVKGVRADYTLDGAYWAFYVGGEYCNYGVSEQPVEDGDNFSIVYTVAQ